jgi:hypothetical protein
MVPFEICGAGEPGANLVRHSYVGAASGWPFRTLATSFLMI